MKELSFNINNTIKVKLTDHGRDILNEYFSEISKYCAGIDIESDDVISSQYAEDEEGYTEFQLWDFMNIFGSYFRLGSPIIIQNNDIIFNEEDLCEVD